MIQNKYTVMVDDNFNYMDKDERYKYGEYDTYGEAAFECKRIVDEFLYNAIMHGTDRKDLYKTYMMFGEDPFVVIPDVPGSENEHYSAREWAKKRCENYIKDETLVPIPFTRPYGPTDDLDGYFDL